ncbi:polysaccharide deacetylase family protein [Candidatus Gracilibacteria bacterium]|nr:polysaccharide deacetylase family protein [Candidatus Gracilibacteria bacterium]
MPTVIAADDPAFFAIADAQIAPTPLAPERPQRILTRDPGYIPILMYHYIREVDEDADPIGYRLSVRPDRFEEQLQWLRAEGYTALRMSDLFACLRGQRACPPRPVALTFDDGYEDQALNALPLLERYQIPATFYIVSGFVGKPGYMSWQQLETLRDAGMEIGGHTVSHADLAGLSLEEARAEIGQSRQLLRRRLGIEVESFAYPAGSYTLPVTDLVQEAGFSHAVTTEQSGTLRRIFRLPRRRVLGGESIEGFPWYFTPLP